MNKQLSEAPIHSASAEANVLSALLHSGDVTIDTCRKRLASPECFYRSEHKVIYKTILKLADKETDIDLVTVSNQLKNANDLDAAGGEAFLIGLATEASSISALDSWIDIVLATYSRRKLLSVGQSLIGESYNGEVDAQEVLHKSIKSLEDILNQSSEQSYKAWTEVLQDVVSHVEQLSNSDDGVSGIRTGFHELDQTIGGFQNSELVILAARPGMGKTALAVKWMMEAAKQNKTVAIMQLEMSDIQFAKRLIAVESNLHANQLYKHGIKNDNQWKHFLQVINDLADLNLNIVPHPGMNVFECVLEARKMKRSKKGLDLLVVDYLQLMGGTNKQRNSNREQEISEVSRELKKLANQLDIPIIALSQLSRAVESRSDKRPKLSDLRESGSIEQDADMVMFIYRPEYYGQYQWENGDTSEGQAEISIAKHRNGSMANVRIGFDNNRVKFFDIAEQQNAVPLVDHRDFENESEQPFG